MAPIMGPKGVPVSFWMWYRNLSFRVKAGYAALLALPGISIIGSILADNSDNLFAGLGKLNTDQWLCGLHIFQFLIVFILLFHLFWRYQLLQKNKEAALARLTAGTAAHCYMSPKRG